MDDFVNSNCKKCSDLKKGRCSGKDSNCLCRFCPRDVNICKKVRWCRETESSFVVEE